MIVVFPDHIHLLFLVPGACLWLDPQRLSLKFSLAQTICESYALSFSHHSELIILDCFSLMIQILNELNIIYVLRTTESRANIWYHAAVRTKAVVMFLLIRC